ncbi:hypothetical protein AB1Y20_005968 [Prymnesium parvum]|uniref:Cilia- and flagella-associated protein 157 n=1 Tax=Prymnesium parvum TaxID=97485 RepID=A0AB34J395_PRYPA
MDLAASLASLGLYADESHDAPYPHPQLPPEETGSLVLALHGELESLRELHARELQLLRAEAEERVERLAEWCAKQLRAVEANRDAVLGEVSEQREAAGAQAALALEQLQASHRQQTAMYRRLLAEEQQRCASARSEVLRVSIEAGNEQLALRAKLQQQRDRSEAAAAALEARLREGAAAAAAREAQLLGRLELLEQHVAQLERAGERQTAAAAQRAAEERWAVQQLEEEKEALLRRVHAAEARAARVEVLARATRAAEEAGGGVHGKSRLLVVPQPQKAAQRPASAPRGKVLAASRRQK